MPVSPATKQPLALIATLLLAATTIAQPPAAPTPTPQNNTWTVPAGSTVTIDRRSGRYTITLPIQPTDGSAEQTLRFADWDAHPYAGSGPYPATREEPTSLP